MNARKSGTVNTVCLTVGLNFVVLVLVYCTVALSGSTWEHASDDELNGRVYAAEFLASIHEQNAALDARGCTVKPQLTDSVWVVNTDKDRNGRDQHDVGVVREVTFDEALDLASHHEVVVQRYCA